MSLPEPIELMAATTALTCIILYLGSNAQMTLTMHALIVFAAIGWAAAVTLAVVYVR